MSNDTLGKCLAVLIFTAAMTLAYFTADYGMQKQIEYCERIQSDQE